MNRSTRSISLTILASLFSFAFVACGPGDSMSNGGADGGGRGSNSGGTDKLGDNASVPGTCQSCLAMSTSNECAAKGRICSGDSGCEKLNTCINKCANINAACIQNCSDGASQDAIDEWNNWAGCDCGTCASQCNATFCSIGYGNGSGSGSGSNGGVCLADNSPCSTTQACCTFCASDNNCGCIPSNNQGCAADEDCCSHDCEGGYCY